VPRRGTPQAFRRGPDPSRAPSRPAAATSPRRSTGAPVRRPERLVPRTPRATSPAATSRGDRHRAARARRNRLVLAVALVVSVGIVGAWFPVSTLLHQRGQLGAASAQLNRLDQQNAALRRQEKQLRTPSTLGRIAQEQYDLVPPGDEAYQVLPPSGSGRSGGTLAVTGGIATGALATGSQSVGGRASSLTRDGSDASSPSGGATSAGFFGRVLQTLEFWR
jgi:cell division protein FtsB